MHEEQRAQEKQEVHKMTLSDEAKMKRREYHRKWSAANRDKLVAAQKRYWEKKARESHEEPAPALREE